LGLVVNSESKIHAKIAPDGSGGAYLTWIPGYLSSPLKSELQDISTVKLYAQRINSSGAKLWSPNDVVVTTTCRQTFGSNLNSAEKNLQIEFSSSVYDMTASSSGMIAAWEDIRNINYDIYAQNVCPNGALGTCPIINKNPIAVISADKFGGVIPVTISFDASSSYDPDGTINAYLWDLGNGTTANTATISQTYSAPGEYNIKLTVTDNKGAKGTSLATVKVFNTGEITVVVNLDVDSTKANGKGTINIFGGCFEGASSANIKNFNLTSNKVMVDMGMTFSTTLGALVGDVVFDPATGTYTQALESGTPGTATITALVESATIGTETVEFTWPQAPVLSLDMQINRSLFAGELNANLSWVPAQNNIYAPASYKIYRSIDGGTAQLIGTVSSTTLAFVDAKLSISHSYSYYVSMVDTDGDESGHSNSVNWEKLQ
jgi:chitodextrinase